MKLLRNVLWNCWKWRIIASRSMALCIGKPRLTVVNALIIVFTTCRWHLHIFYWKRTLFLSLSSFQVCRLHQHVGLWLTSCAFKLLIVLLNIFMMRNNRLFFHGKGSAKNICFYLWPLCGRMDFLLCYPHTPLGYLLCLSLLLIFCMNSVSDIHSMFYFLKAFWHTIPSSSLVWHCFQHGAGKVE